MNRQSDGRKPIKIWVDEFDEEDWQALYMTDLEELFEYDKDYLRVF